MQFGWINIFGLAILIIIMVPNVFYAIRFRNAQNRCSNKLMNIIEQIGRYASFLLMFFPLGVWKFGFPNEIALLIYIIVNSALLIAYLVTWAFYFKNRSNLKTFALAILPICIFLVSGITLDHWLLVIAALIFGIGHVYVTYQNI